MDLTQTALPNEQLTAEAFNRQSSVFDELNAGNCIETYMRTKVRAHVEAFLPANSKILELNAGTGIDAVYFAGKGHSVHATDVASSMQGTLKHKVAEAHLEHLITAETCSFTQLAQLQKKQEYDAVFSNSGGLNCTPHLQTVLQSFSPLVKKGGTVTMAIMGRYCLWEMLHVFRGNFKLALRRLKNGADAHIEGVHFKCWYYQPSYVINALKQEFNVVRVEGLCTFVPPSYFENFPTKHPGLYKRLVKMEEKYSTTFPWKNIGDYFIITLQKK